MLILRVYGVSNYRIKFFHLDDGDIDKYFHHNHSNKNETVQSNRFKALKSNTYLL